MSNIDALESFAHKLEVDLNYLRDIRRSFNKRLAFDFNIINEFISLNENMLSDILAFFLNPESSHGQGKVFLEVFLKHFKREKELNILNENNCIVEVRREHCIDNNRRIDVTVTINPGKHIIGIENKVEAIDQNNQINDYLSYLKQKSNPNNCILYYLTPDGRNPSESSLSLKKQSELINQNHLRCLSYSEDILQLLAEFETVCCADNVRAFIRDFSNYLVIKFKGAATMDEQDRVVSLLKSHPEVIKSWNTVADSLDKVRKEMHDKTWAMIQKHINSYSKYKMDNVPFPGENNCIWIQHKTGEYPWASRFNPPTIYIEDESTYISIGLPKKRDVIYCDDPSNIQIIKGIEDALSSDIPADSNGDYHPHTYWIGWKKIMPIKCAYNNDDLAELVKLSDEELTAMSTTTAKYIVDYIDAAVKAWDAA